MDDYDPIRERMARMHEPDPTTTTMHTTRVQNHGGEKGSGATLWALFLIVGALVGLFAFLSYKPPYP
jgi:hypothetical protein